MKRNSIFSLFILLLFFCSVKSHALDHISLGLGKSRDSINIYRLGVRKEFGVEWFESKIGYISGYHEVSLNYWEYSRESIKGAMYSPVFIHEFSRLHRNIFPYLEAGIGVGYISEKTIKRRNLSSHFQFEDRAGIGAKLGKQKTHDLSVRYMHYSNAGIWQPNDGIDIFIFSYTYSF